MCKPTGTVKKGKRRRINKENYKIKEFKSLLLESKTWRWILESLRLHVWAMDGVKVQRERELDTLIGDLRFVDVHHEILLPSAVHLEERLSVP